jgi:hypothetical protein
MVVSSITYLIAYLFFFIPCPLSRIHFSSFIRSPVYGQAFPQQSRLMSALPPPIVKYRTRDLFKRNLQVFDGSAAIAECLFYHSGIIEQTRVPCAEPQRFIHRRFASAG